MRGQGGEDHLPHWRRKVSNFLAMLGIVCILIFHKHLSKHDDGFSDELGTLLEDMPLASVCHLSTRSSRRCGRRQAGAPGPREIPIFGVI